MQAARKRFAGVWLLITLAGLTAIAAFNVLVDPLGAFPAWHLKTFEPLRYLETDRVAKAEMARRGDWQTIILGSSRAQVGLPATHPVLAGNHGCNLSMVAATFPEVVAVFDYTRERNPLKRVILGLDLYMFSEGPRWAGNFVESRFCSGFDRFQYYCKQLIGRTSTDRSWEAVRRKMQDYKPPIQETLGFYHFSLWPGMSQRKLFESLLRTHAADYPSLKVDRARVSLFRHLVRTCRDEKIDLRVAIMPPHALDIEMLYASQRWGEFEQWKADLVDVLAEEGVEGKVGLWDFTGYAGPPAEPVPQAGDMTNRMTFYLEGSHFTPSLGKLILDAMFDPAGASSFGARLDRSNLKAHLARILEDRAAYVRTNAPDIAWVQRILSEVSGKPSARREQEQNAH